MRLPPHTNAEWLQWLDEHDTKFREALRTATARRRIHNERLAPLAEPLEPATRLQAIEHRAPAATWAKKLLHAKTGFYSLRCPGYLLVLFCCPLRGSLWGLPLDRVRNRVYSWCHTRLLCDVLQPVECVLAAMSFPSPLPELDVHAL